MITLRRTHLVRGATALMVSVVLALWSVPAHAADEVGFSNDGVTWAPALPQPLFDPDFRWVPGDTQTATFFVRNQGPTTAVMAIEVRSADTDELLAHHDIDLHVRADGGTWTSLENGVASGPLSEGSIAQGEAVEVEVRAAFDPASVNQSQTKRLPLAFTVTVADVASIPVPESPDHASPGAAGHAEGISVRAGLLPSTGTTIGPGLVLGALALCALGAILIARRPSDDDAPNGVTS